MPTEPKCLQALLVKAGNSSKGMDHLLPPGLGKSERMAQAALLHPPFRMRDWPEPDVHFVLMAIATWQEFLPAYTAKLRHYVSCVVKALKPLDLALSQFRGEAAKRVAATASTKTTPGNQQTPGLHTLATRQALA